MCYKACLHLLVSRLGQPMNVQQPSCAESSPRADESAQAEADQCGRGLERVGSRTGVFWGREHVGKGRWLDWAWEWSEIGLGDLGRILTPLLASPTLHQTSKSKQICTSKSK